jgi:Uma2 family endonuclease
MTTTAVFPEAGVGPGPRPLYRFTVKQYHHLIDAGVLRSGDRVELLEGYLVPKMTQKPPHPTSLEILRDILAARVPSEWIIRSQAPITTQDSEPEPDLAVVLGPRQRYWQKHPRPADTALVIEVADTTLSEDQGRKQRIYARARVPVYWIVNLPESQVEVYTEPRGGRAPAYRRCQVYCITDSVPIVVAGQDQGVFPVRDILPSRGAP